MSWFSNSDDGDYGQTSGEVGYDPRRGELIKPDWWRRLRWWMRNPAHDKSFGEWRKPGGWFISLPPLGYLGYRFMPLEPSRNGAFGAAGFRGYPTFWTYRWDAWPLRWWYKKEHELVARLSKET